MTNYDRWIAKLQEMKKTEADFMNKHGDRISELVSVCKKSQGEYLESHHGPGSWATTYSNEFISASLQLYELYKSCPIYDPVWAMSNLFREHGIRSCRGSEMFPDRVEYLYETHLKRKLAKDH